MQYTYTACFSILLAEMAKKNTYALLPHVAEDEIASSDDDFDVRTQHKHLMKMFTLPDGYKYTKKDEVIKQFQDEALQAAWPAPALAQPPAGQKQLPISSFFVANNTQH